jgi:acetylornithine deacetylase/succinyl-diaminopimelate desuccinylase-like protein
LLNSAAAGVVSPDAEAIRLGQDAFEAVLGIRPALIRTGGTLPIVAAFADKGVPTIISGFSLPDANIHAPNENMPAEYIPLGIQTAKALFQELGKLK